ncbi:MAG: DUF1385 domain-containing protein [Chloroflexi bacterium]|nr:DUF1385 domain-containing protein [Chloroflexota bacterium]MBU1749184.1 DUF1385 domain-containing protein [Chloroflexota bacterium]
MEGIMMRGQSHMALAVREPSGGIFIYEEPLTSFFYTHKIARWPFVRGITMLWDALVLGTRALMKSANVALEEEGEEMSPWMIAVTLLLSLGLAVAIFFVTPVILTGLVDAFVHSTLLSVTIEGVIRLGFFLVYLVLIGMLPDIRRVFAYHGAEHKTINAYEAGAPLDVDTVSQYPKEHRRCGTGFLLVVLVVSILVFGFMGRPDWFWRIGSRIVLIPVVAAISYEIVRWSAAHCGNRLVRALMAPTLALQSLTTREPDRSQIEVGIAALQRVLAAEGLTTPPAADPEAVP